MNTGDISTLVPVQVAPVESMTNTASALFGRFSETCKDLAQRVAQATEGKLPQLMLAGALLLFVGLVSLVVYKIVTTPNPSQQQAGNAAQGALGGSKDKDI